MWRTVIFSNKISTKIIKVHFILGAPKGSEKGAFFDVSSRTSFFTYIVGKNFFVILSFLPGRFVAVLERSVI